MAAAAARILSVSFGYPSDAAPARMLFTHEQARALARAGAEVSALDLAPPPGIDGADARDGIRVFRVPTPRSFRRPSALPALLEARSRVSAIVRSGGYGLVLMSFLDHKHGPFFGVLGAEGARRAFTVHGVDAMARHDPPHVRALKLALLRRADHVFPVSRETGALVEGLLRPGARAAVEVIENGVDRAKLERARAVRRAEHRRRWRWPESRPVVLSVGNLVPRKGFDRLLDAAAALRDRGRSFLWVMVGRGAEAEALDARAARLGLEDRVRFVRRYVSDDELAGAMAACDVFALASRTLTRPPAMEGFGVVYAEASYLGRPVVGGRSGGVPTAVADGETGLLVDPEGPEAGGRFADAIEAILDDPSLAARLGANGRARALERFDWDLNARRVLSAARCTSG